MTRHVYGSDGSDPDAIERHAARVLAAIKRRRWFVAAGQFRST